jgi:hypothetical protein
VPLAIITARIESPSFIACSKGFNIITPHPSPLPKPDPLSSNAIDRPESDSNLHIISFQISVASIQKQKQLTGTLKMKQKIPGAYLSGILQQ